jgi:hypothetical protein
VLLRANALQLTECQNAFVDLGADGVRVGAIGSDLGFDEGDGALLEVAHELRCNP